MSEAEETTSLEEDLAAAFDASVAEEEEETTDEVEVDTSSDTDSEVEGEEDTGETEEETTEDDSTEEVASTESTEDVVADESAADTSTVPAPASWTPAAREDWAKLPQTAQAEVVRREREIEAGLRESSEARKFQENFAQMVKPYESTIAVEAGGDAMLAAKNLMNIATGLRVGAGPQKAQIVAQIIQGYGVDIPTLDNILSGQMGPSSGQTQAPMGNPQPMRDPRVDQMLAERQQEEKNRSAVMESEATAFINDPVNEFAKDVRDDMADFIELAGRRGKQLTLKEAYDQAVLLRPDIQSIISKRTADPTPTPSDGTSLKRKKRASATIKGTPGGDTSVKAGGESLTDDLNAAWDAAVEG